MIISRRRRAVFLRTAGTGHSRFRPRGAPFRSPIHQMCRLIRRFRIQTRPAGRVGGVFLDFIPPSMAHLPPWRGEKGRRSLASCTPRYSRPLFSSSEGGIDQERRAAAPSPREGGAAPQIALLFSFQSISETQKLHFAAFDSGNVPGFGGNGSPERGRERRRFHFGKLKRAFNRV